MTAQAPSPPNEKNGGKGEKPSETKSKLVAILIRGIITVNSQQLSTFHLLGLRKKNSCVLLDNSPTNRGMIQKVKDFITWGEPNDKMIKKLEETGGKLNLHPPRGGFARKGIKIPFKVGGALGYRGDKISDLLERMMP